MRVSAPPTDFERDLTKISGELDRLAAEPTSADRATRIANCRYRRASLTGDLTELEQAENAVEDGIAEFGPWPDLCLLRANIDFKFHRLARVRGVLELSPALRESPEGGALLADLDFQEGRYGEARRGYESLVEQHRTWTALARLADLELRLGDAGRADELYADAADELTAKELRSFCWIELRRGEIDFARGRYSEAAAHYERAERAYSGDRLVDEHRAEVLAAREELDEALALYARLVERAPRPELHQALGDLCLHAGRPEESRRWHDLALAVYLDSVERGGVHYFHHLSGFYLDSRRDPAAATYWARKDLELRPSFPSQLALARALHASGEVAAALGSIEAALSSGAQSAHLFSAAANIYFAAGLTAEAERFQRRAIEINPRLHDFHVHR